MPIKKYKNSRAVNINTNIVIAGILATIVATYPVYLTKMITDSNILIVLLSFFIDAVIDFFIFVGLHISVHKHHLKKFKPSKLIIKDVANIQMQRVVLSVLYFIVAVGLHYLLLEAGMGRASSFLISYLVALVVTRSVHTIYGFKTGLFKPI